MISNKFLGHASTQSPQAVQSATSTTGRPKRFIVIAPNEHDTAQSPYPRQPHEQPLPPPATAAAAPQVRRPRYSACNVETFVPPAHISRATRLFASPLSTPRYSAMRTAPWSSTTLQPAGFASPATILSAKPRHPGEPQAPQLAPGSMDVTASMRGSSHTRSFQ